MWDVLICESAADEMKTIMFTVYLIKKILVFSKSTNRESCYVSTITI